MKNVITQYHKAKTFLNRLPDFGRSQRLASIHGLSCFSAAMVEFYFACRAGFDWYPVYGHSAPEIAKIMLEAAAIMVGPTVTSVAVNLGWRAVMPAMRLPAQMVP